ncbi:MAG: M1 family peptidase, partial [Gemmatimonadales bacterium]
MTVRSIAALALIASAVAALPVSAQQTGTVPLGTPSTAPRAVRRDIPLTNMIRRAWADGTRDSTGRPGRNYWQLWNDYTINARFDAPTSSISGSERIVVHNNSDSAMRTIVLRLDQNIYRANVPRAETVPDITDGMVVTRLIVDGANVDLSD